MDNRRAHPRYATSLSVEVHVGKDLILATANNLSIGGIGIMMQRPLVEKASVNLSMFLVEEGIEDETTAPLDIRGVVVWCTPQDMGGFLAGLQFGPLTPSQHQTITHFLQRLKG